MSLHFTVVTCAKFLSDRLIKIEITSKLSFVRFHWWASKISMKWSLWSINRVPGASPTHILGCTFWSNNDSRIQLMESYKEYSISSADFHQDMSRLKNHHKLKQYIHWRIGHCLSNDSIMKYIIVTWTIFQTHLIRWVRQKWSQLFRRYLNSLYYIHSSFTEMCSHVRYQQ